MKKILLAFLFIIFLFIAFSSGFYFGKKQFNENLVAKKTEAIRNLIDPYGTVDKETVEAQLELSKIQYMQELSESRGKWVEYAVVIILALNLILSIKIFSEPKKIK